MYPIHRILVAIKDPAAKSHPTVAKAVEIAAALDAQILLFNAIDALYPDGAVLSDVELEFLRRRRLAHRTEQLEALAKPLRATGLTVSTAVAWDFPRHEAIIRAAEKFDANLIIAADHVATHRVPWLRRYTDWELLRVSPIPVLLVKNWRPYRTPAILAALDPTCAFSKPDSLDAQILHFSATLAQALAGKIHVVHGFSPIPATLPTAALSTIDAIEKQVNAAQTQAREALHKETRHLGLSEAQIHVEGRHPRDAVVDVAREIRSQIVVLGQVARKGMERLIIGSTAEGLLDTLDCDVLVVKPPSFRHTVARAARTAARAAS